jgi:hypothetical protein
MFVPAGGGRRRIQELVAKFREKGATSAEKAMTAQELGLPPRFEQAMRRRLGATGIFVDIGGKYYLDEARLQQVQQQRRGARGAGWGMGGAWGSRGNMFTLRIARMVVGLVAVALALSNLFLVESGYVRLVIVALVVVWIVLTAFQLLYLSRMRSRWGASGFSSGAPPGTGAP